MGLDRLAKLEPSSYMSVPTESDQTAHFGFGPCCLGARVGSLVDRLLS